MFCRLIPIVFLYFSLKPNHKGGPINWSQTLHPFHLLNTTISVVQSEVTSRFYRQRRRLKSIKTTAVYNWNSVESISGKTYFTLSKSSIEQWFRPQLSFEEVELQWWMDLVLTPWETEKSEEEDRERQMNILEYDFLNSFNWKLSGASTIYTDITTKQWTTITNWQLSLFH